MSLLSKIISLGIVISSFYPHLKSLRFKKRISKEDEESQEEPSYAALLKEYEVCHKEKHAQASTYWTIVGIFLSVITAVAGYLISGILKEELSHEYTRCMILGFSVIAILIIALLGLWLERTRKIIGTANDRMCALENQLGMQLNNNIRNKLKEKRFWRLFTGRLIAYILFLLILIPWIFLIILIISFTTG